MRQANRHGAISNDKTLSSGSARLSEREVRRFVQADAGFGLLRVDELEQQFAFDGRDDGDAEFVEETPHP